MRGAFSTEFPLRIGRTVVKDSFIEHQHEYSELVILLGGTGTHRVDGRNHFATAGDVYVFQGESTHGFVDCHELTMCNAAFGPSILEPAHRYLRQLPGYQALFVLGAAAARGGEFPCRLRLALPQLKEAERRVDAMIAEHRERKPGWEAVLTGKFIELVAWLSREYAPPPESVQDAVHSLALAVSHLEKEFLEPLRLPELAAMAGLSSRQFLRSFRAHYGTTPIDYALRLRLHHAARLLVESDATAVDIAGASGFSDGNYFARQFRRVMGVSPLAFRRRER